MKRKLNLALLSTLLLTALLLTLTGCDVALFGDKAPVYEGMTVSAYPGVGHLTGGIYMESTETPDIEELYGQVKGDCTDSLPTFNENDPFPGKDITSAILSSVKVESSYGGVFTTDPGKDVYVNIRISNPKGYTISSLTLNGEKYTSYTFEKSSTPENVIVKISSGETAGILQITVDAIKYLDGSEIKDVTMSGDKTVSIGVNAKDQLTASITGVSSGVTSLTVNGSVSDEKGLLSFSDGAVKAVLFDGSRIVATKDASVGSFSATFDSLKPNTLYQYAIVGYYDDFSGSGFGMHLLAKGAIYTASTVLFDNVKIDQDSIKFDFLWHETHANGSITSIELFDGETLLESADYYGFDGLLSGKTYRIVAEYQSGSVASSISIEFATLPKKTPVVMFNTPMCTPTSIRYGIIESDPDAVGEIVKVELLRGDFLIAVEENPDRRIFENLASGTTYKLRATYVYDLNDGNGPVTVTRTAVANTPAKSEPYITIRDLLPDVNGVSATYTIDDPSCAITSYAIELYKGGNLVATCDGKDSKIGFSSLEQFTEYTVRITYTFSKNDGTPAQTRTVESAFKTRPYIDATSLTVLNTAPVSNGEIITALITLNNPSKTRVESVVINGRTYPVDCSYAADRLYASILCEGQFTGGDTELVLERINALPDGEPYSATPSLRLSDNVFVNGDIGVLDFTIVNDSYETIEWAFPSDKVYALITVSNPSGYAITSINGVTEVIRLDDSRWCYSIDLSRGWNTCYLTSVAYSGETAKGTLNCSDIKATVFEVVSNDVHYVRGPIDLMNMNGGHYYELACDIDLSDVQWQGRSFYGVLCGKGYSIKNMTFTDKTDGDAYLGLFRVGTGIIEDLDIEAARISTDLRSESGSSHDAYCGGLVGYADGILSVKGCSVDSSSSFSVKADDAVCIGGLVGYASTSSTVSFTDCSSAASINGSASDALIGFSAAKN